MAERFAYKALVQNVGLLFWEIERGIIKNDCEVNVAPKLTLNKETEGSVLLQTGPSPGPAPARPSRPWLSHCTSGTSRKSPGELADRHTGRRPGV